MLTKRQRSLLVYLSEQIAASGTAPSYQEIASEMNLTSKSGVHRLVNALEERGFIRRIPNRARAIEIVRTVEAAAVLPFDTDAAIQTAKLLTIEQLEAIIADKRLAA
jgi:repressor LexA